MPEAAMRRPLTVFVTGAAGFIGSTLSRRLLAAGHRVIGYDNLSRGRRDYLPRTVELVEGDIRDGQRLHGAVTDVMPDSVVHLAAMHFIPDCVARPQETLDVNVEGTRIVLESCRRSSIRSFVFASTGAVYAPTDGPCLEDATPLRPLETYGESKLAAERLVAAFHRDTGTPAGMLRLFNTIGRRETNPHVIPHILESLRTSDAVPLGNTEPRRDYIDVRDVAEAMLAVAEGVRGFHVLNVGTGVAHSVNDVVTLLGRILGRPIVTVQEPSRARTTDRMLLVADIRRIQSLTAWAPRIDLEETLRDLVQAYGLSVTAR
jgi:UDP-glucose 4-epimerase